MIPEPQKTYLLELLTALGGAADEFVLVGGQALKFVLAGARATKDFDFLLDAISLREKPANVAEKLAALRYTVVPESQNFQFQKAIPGTNEVMRVEFMAPRELKRENDFRVTIEKGLHAWECLGGIIAIHESDNLAETSNKPTVAPGAAANAETPKAASLFDSAPEPVRDVSASGAAQRSCAESRTDEDEKILRESYGEAEAEDGDEAA
jgi:hypothetical protein